MVSIINIQLVVLIPVHLSESIQFIFLKRRTVPWKCLRTRTSNYVNVCQSQQNERNIFQKQKTTQIAGKLESCFNGRSTSLTANDLHWRVLDSLIICAFPDKVNEIVCQTYFTDRNCIKLPLVLQVRCYTPPSSRVWTQNWLKDVKQVVRRWMITITAYKCLYQFLVCFICDVTGLNLNFRERG